MKKIVAIKSTPLIGFVSQYNEAEMFNAPILGNLPIWLRGSIFRNGPAQMEVGTNSYKHWFDGLSMLVSFTFEDNGSVTFRSKFLQSNAYKDENTNRKILYRGFATDPCGGIFRRITQGWYDKFSDNANVSIIKQGEHFIAMTEPTLQIEFDQLLSRFSPLNFQDRLHPQLMTPHPQIDPISGQLYNLLTFLSFRSSHSFSSQNSDSLSRQVLTSQSTWRPSYHHSFAMSENYLVQTNIPYTVNPLLILFSGKPYIENYHWDGNSPTIFRIYQKNSGELIKEASVDPFFTFHHLNGFEDKANNRLIVDLITYSDPSIITCFYFKNLLNQDTSFPTTQLRRYYIPLDDGPTTFDVICNSIELPRINDRYISFPYKFAYAVGVNETNIFSHLVKVNLETKEILVWKQEGQYPGEPIFVPNPSSKNEDGGVILSIVLDGRSDHVDSSIQLVSKTENSMLKKQNIKIQQDPSSNSGEAVSPKSKDDFIVKQSAKTYLLVLDAETFQECARVELNGYRIPFGLHGQFYNS